MYGTMDTTMHANAAQVKAKPDPDDTTIPTEMGGSPMSRLLTASVRLMRTVQMLAPMRISKLPTMENSVETKKVKLRLRTPVTSAKEAQMVPRSNIQYAALEDCPK